MADARFKLEDLIGSLCSTGATSLDQVVLKEIKSLCRDNDTNCQYSYQILLNHLQKEHSEVRFSALQIVDCLFQRSHAFREMLLDELQQFFELVLGTYFWHSFILLLKIKSTGLLLFTFDRNKCWQSFATAAQKSGSIKKPSGQDNKKLAREVRRGIQPVRSGIQVFEKL